MEHTLPRASLWADKKNMDDYMNEPLNRKLYELFLEVKRQSPSQDFLTLQLFNEVYYLCSRIVHENNPHPFLNDYINEIKHDMGWDYPSSIVLNMVYVVLSLRQGNSIEVNQVVEMIRTHYKMDSYKTPFTTFVNEEKIANHEYSIHLNNNDDSTLQKNKSTTPIKDFNITLNISPKLTKKCININISPQFYGPVGQVLEHVDKVENKT